MKISEVLGINKSKWELDFFDYDIYKDTYKFIDPYYISKKEDVFLQECNEYISSFFNKFLFFLRNNEDKKAFDLFSHLGEVNEICLGMSREKPRGKGMGPGDAKKIFEAIKNSKAFKKGLINCFEDIRIFVNGIDKDKISDMVANIIRKPLIDYTINQCNLYNYKMVTDESDYYWDKNNWVRGHCKCIIYEDKKYLLYPRNLVSSSKWFSSGEFFRTYIMDYLKEENLKNDTHLVTNVYNEKGEIINKKVLKKSIKEDFQKQNITTDKNWITDFIIKHPNIYSNYKKFCIDKLDIKESNIIDYSSLDFLIDSLIDQLKQIPEGSENASLYHNHMLGIMELLFYPNLSNPIKENEIHEGRKRIDISMNNVAEQGFFYLLGTSYNIPCSKIIIECKNYSKDIQNPEFDQIAGRFSAKRGKFGIICCRKLNNRELFLQREIDTFRDDRGLIFHLTDDDIIDLLNIKKQNLDISKYLSNRYFEIVNRT